MACRNLFRREAEKERSGDGNRSRTCDLRITNALLCQLSYTGKDEKYGCYGKKEPLLRQVHLFENIHIYPYDNDIFT